MNLWRSRRTLSRPPTRRPTPTGGAPAVVLGAALRAAWGFVLLPSLLTGACAGPESVQPDVSADSGPTADLVQWSQDTTGTTSAPVYGRCRLGAERVLWAPSNGALDDDLTLSVSGAEADLTIRVVGAAGIQLESHVTLERALKDKSYRRATGTARWPAEGLDVQVVDGTLCFAERLASGVPVEGEFSLILATGAGAYASVSGGFQVPAEAVSVADEALVTAQGVDVDLR